MAGGKRALTDPRRRTGLSAVCKSKSVYIYIYYIYISLNL